jgi:hypothetical protein
VLGTKATARNRQDDLLNRELSADEFGLAPGLAHRYGRRNRSDDPRQSYTTAALRQRLGRMAPRLFGRADFQTGEWKRIFESQGWVLPWEPSRDDDGFVRSMVGELRFVIPHGASQFVCEHTNSTF